MRYEHDCKSCHPIGQFLNYDIYYCDFGAVNETVVARYGDHKTAYHSGLTMTNIPAIKVAVAMAEAANLLEAQT